MSGRKESTVTINQSRYNQLLNDANRATNLANSNRALNELNRTLTNSLNQSNARINTLTTNLNQLNTNLNNVRQAASKEASELRAQLQATIRESNDRLNRMAEANRQQITNLQNNFNAALDQTRRDTAATIAANNRRIENIIDQNNQRIQSQIQQTNTRIDTVNNRVTAINNVLNNFQSDLSSMRDHATEFINAAQTLLNDCRNYRCELLLPGQLAEVTEQLNTAIQNMELPLANAPVARNEARRAYLDALNFHEQIIQAEQEWTLRHRAAMESVALSQARIEASRTIIHQDTQIPIDVDFWSNGDLSEMSEHAEALMASLNNGQNTLTVADLDHIRQTANWIECETSNSATFALFAAETSQERACTAQDVCNILQDATGMELQDHAYAADDMRAAHRFHMKNPHTGLSLVITQKPAVKTEDGLKCPIEFEITDPGSNNQNSVAELFRTLNQRMRDYGYDMGDLTEIVGYEDIHSGRKETANIRQWATTPTPIATPAHTKPPVRRTNTSRNTQR